jgi:hypothetical protein
MPSLSRRFRLFLLATVMALWGLLVATGVWLFVPGPSPPARSRTEFTFAQSMSIQEGMTQAQVEDFLGAPPGDYRTNRAEPRPPRQGHWEDARIVRAEFWTSDTGEIEVDFDAQGRVVGGVGFVGGEKPQSEVSAIEPDDWLDRILKRVQPLTAMFDWPGVLVGAVVGGIVGAIAYPVIVLLSPRQVCPDCGTEFPLFRGARSWWDAFIKRRACANCGCVIDRRGRKLWRGMPSP